MKEKRIHIARHTVRFATDMNLPMSRTSEFRPSPLMTIYQFVFFTFYQIIEKVSSSGLKEYRAALLVSALQMWLTIDVLTTFGRLLHPPYDPPESIVLMVGVPISFGVYFVIFERGSYKAYFAHFGQLPKRKLIIGRLLVLVAVLALFTTIMFQRSHLLR